MVEMPVSKNKKLILARNLLMDEILDKIVVVNKENPKKIGAMRLQQ